MSKDTLIIDGCQYDLTPRQLADIERAQKVLDDAFAIIEREDIARHDALNNAGDPYVEPILEYQKRVREIVGVQV